MNKQQLASKIWAAANEMRSKIEASEYKDYILGFIFYKFLSEQEESFAIYENRVLMTLIRRALHFVDDKYSKMKGVPNDTYTNIKVIRSAEFDDKKVDFAFNYINDSHETLADDLDVLDVSELSDFDRIRRIRTTPTNFSRPSLCVRYRRSPRFIRPLPRPTF